MSKVPARNAGRLRDVETIKKKRLPWVATAFDRTDKSTDFAYLSHIEHRTLFLFNDSEECFPCGTLRGGGNACVRPLRAKYPPRSAGIPTGCNGRGYESLTPANRAAIDAAFSIIDWLVLTGRYDRVRYCCDKANLFKLGTGIYDVGDSVIAYISSKIEVRAGGRKDVGAPPIP